MRNYLQNLEWAPQFSQGLSNHLPMVVQALQTMQASDTQILNYIEHASSKLEQLPSVVGLLQLKDWHEVCELKGQYIHYMALHHYFAAQINNDLNNPLIAQYIQDLAPGISSGAFHPFIRLGHALAGNNVLEVVSAFAYWIYAYSELTWPDNPLQASPSLDITISSLLNAVDWPTGRLGIEVVTSDMRQVREQCSFHQLSFKPDAKNIDFAEMELSALNLYLACDDFTVLHAVTATYSTRIVKEQYPQIDNLLLYLWQGVVTAYLSKGITALHQQNTLKTLNTLTCYSREQVRYFACCSLDDHSIKLAAVCLRMHKVTGNDNYLLAITRKLKNDHSTAME
ncbi:MAG: questin oxidase family protein [Oceanospirillaceae bacterium]